MDTTRYELGQPVEGVHIYTPHPAGRFVLHEHYESVRLKHEAAKFAVAALKKELQDERDTCEVLREEIRAWRNRALRAEQGVSSGR